MITKSTDKTNRESNSPKAMQTMIIEPTDIEETMNESEDVEVNETVDVGVETIETTEATEAVDARTEAQEEVVETPTEEQDVEESLDAPVEPPVEETVSASTSVEKANDTVTNVDAILQIFHDSIAESMKRWEEEHPIDYMASHSQFDDKPKEFIIEYMTNQYMAQDDSVLYQNAHHPEAYFEKLHANESYIVREAEYQHTMTIGYAKRNIAASNIKPKGTVLDIHGDIEQYIIEHPDSRFVYIDGTLYEMTDGPTIWEAELTLCVNNYEPAPFVDDGKWVLFDIPFLLGKGVKCALMRNGCLYVIE